MGGLGGGSGGSGGLGVGGGGPSMGAIGELHKYLGGILAVTFRSQCFGGFENDCLLIGIYIILET